MDDESNKKLSQVLTLLIILITVYQMSPPFRYACLKLKVWLRWKLRPFVREFVRLSDPAWKRELDDQPELFSWPTREPGWLKLDAVGGDDAKVSISTPS